MFPGDRSGNLSVDHFNITPDMSSVGFIQKFLLVNCCVANNITNYKSRISKNVFFFAFPTEVVFLLVVILEFLH